ncbi:transposase, partial [Coprobacter fastidiosus]
MGNNKTKYTSLYEFFSKFPNEESARKYFELKRWNGHVSCPHCGSNHIAECKDQKPMPYRCKDCRKFFSVRFGTILEESKLPLHK